MQRYQEKTTPAAQAKQDRIWAPQEKKRRQHSSSHSWCACLPPSASSQVTHASSAASGGLISSFRRHGRYLATRLLRRLCVPPRFFFHQKRTKFTRASQEHETGKLRGMVWGLVLYCRGLRVRTYVSLACAFLVLERELVAPNATLQAFSRTWPPRSLPDRR